MNALYRFFGITTLTLCKLWIRKGYCIHYDMDNMANEKGSNEEEVYLPGKKIWICINKCCEVGSILNSNRIE